MAVGPVILPTSGHAAWNDLATWWLSRYKVSTQQTSATYLPRWTAWCAGRGLDPLQAGRADVEPWLRTVADSGLSRASTAGHDEAVASLYRLACDENLIAIDPCARMARPKVLRELQRHASHQVAGISRRLGQLTPPKMKPTPRRHTAATDRTFATAASPEGRRAAHGGRPWLRG